MNILAIDISTSNIGYAIFDEKGTYITSGSAKLPTSEQAKRKGYSEPYRMNETKKIVDAIIDETKPDVVIVEDFAKKFSAGKSSAHVVGILAAFNYFFCWTVFNKLGWEPAKVSVVHARNVLQKFFQQKSIENNFGITFKLKSKDDVVPFLKTIEVYSPDMTEDECDAIILALYYVIANYPKRIEH